MIMYENLSIPVIIDAMESMAETIVKNTHPESPVTEDEIVRLLEHYDITAYINEDLAK